jgi:hypothetical protein
MEKASSRFCLESWPVDAVQKTQANYPDNVSGGGQGLLGLSIAIRRIATCALTDTSHRFLVSMRAQYTTEACRCQSPQRKYNHGVSFLPARLRRLKRGASIVNAPN